MPSTDLAENRADDRRITHSLYGGDEAYRLKREMRLGIGGVRLLGALGFSMRKYHLNESHAALLTLELLRRLAHPPALVYLTNTTALPALTFCALYKSRWQVELFFKWSKEQLRIKRFLGTSENAVRTQIWCAVATYVLIAIVKWELHLDASHYTCLQILLVSDFEKTEVSCALQPDRSQTDQPIATTQLILFHLKPHTTEEFPRSTIPGNTRST